MTTLNKIAILQRQQDYTEPNYTDLKSTINEGEFPYAKEINN
jgi:hypothetical protein